MARNLQRIQAELILMADLLGPDTFEFSDDGSMVLFPRLRLPRGKFNQATATCLVLIPPNYGYGARLSEFYMDASLRMRRGGRFIVVPHHYAMHKTSAEIHRLVRERMPWVGPIPDLKWICLHPRDDVTIDEFLDQVHVFLSNE